ncbi:DNA repair exonuclease [Tetragenococcus koreensis]|uniref:Phosphoesterase n=1 Tax=Tetragenococcus koreensis TaxID=290335 RepID=A0AAN4RIU5_9ENTE|nr:DNA repair exonuclease [Tetragenococcus koreensis]MCF1584955.1 DNA repair exonuclease [Tetragenococcus koreensis]MCF1614468.1 DNA repair exonuclease [Tetragenococcus koreensis]MCF1617221.1 DNA repair exonuclease [Tetragenococcus koreensis]MCF1619871.1 DNA repair exonuclease [Tetragenococcus koreensis]MCF1622104.1 DNA repair exonuclease [Tetragenococcus koreensis]
MLRFIHCADLHFDRPFEGLHLIADKAKKLPRENEQVLSNIVTLAIEETVDFLLFAGDTFHQNRPTLKTQQQFFQQMERLNKEHIPVYMIFGNHDYYEKERYWFDFPANVQLFKEENVQTITGRTKKGESYAISSFSYLHPQISKKKINEFPTKQEGYHLGMYHGDMGSDRFAPFQLQEMKRKNYDYWALGHIHVPTVLSQEAAILYAGTPQGHTQKEEATGVNLVTIENGHTTWQTEDVSAVRWKSQDVLLTGIQQQKAVLEEIISAFQKSEKALVKLRLRDTKLLPQNWLQEKEILELIAYVNDYLASHHFQQLVYQIEINEETTAEKITISADKELIEHLLTIYQQQNIFTETVNELATYPLAQQALSWEQLQEETFMQMKQELQSEFSWRNLDGTKEG